MQVEHLFSYNLYHELWNQNLINKEGFIIADTRDLKRYKALLEEQPIRRGAKTHKNRKKTLDKTQELLKCETLTAGQEEDLYALLQSLQLDVGEDGDFVPRPDVQPPKKKYPGVREPSLSLWELKIDEAERAKKVQRQDLRTLDKWLCQISDSKARARKSASCETADWKELEKRCRKRTRDRLNEMEMKRRNKINSFHADNDYARKKMCGMKKVSKEKSLETMYPLRQAAPHILAPPKSAIDRGFGVPKKEERDDTLKNASFKQKATDNDYARKKMCGMKVSPKKVSKEKSLETMYSLRQAAPHILAPPKSAIDRGFGVPKKEERDDTLKNASFKQKASEIAENLDANLDDASSLPKVYEKEKVFSFDDHVVLSLAERKAQKEEKIRKRLKLFQRMIARKTADQEEWKNKEQQKLDKTYSSMDKSKLGSRESETSFKKDLRKVKERITRDAISAKEDKMISDDEKGVLHEEEILRKSEEFETLIKSENGERRQDVIEDKMTSKLTLSDDSRESLLISETISDILNLVELNDGKLKEPNVEGPRNLRQSLPVVPSILTFVVELLKDMSCSVEINMEEKKLTNLLHSDTTKESLPRTYEEGRDDINESTRNIIEDNLEVIEKFDDLLNSIASEEPTGCHLKDFDKSADAARRVEINESTRETIEENLDVIETSDNLLDSITSEEPTKGHLEDADQLTDAEGRGKVNESVRVTLEDNLDVIKTFDDFLNSIASEEPTGFHLEDFDKSVDAARRVEINELTRETIKANLDVIETSDNLLDSITSEEPIKGHLEDADQLTDAEGRGKVNESVRATVEDNLDVIKTFDDFLNSIASEEPTGCHLEDFDKSADAARRVEINESTRETIEENLDVIETSDNLLDSITSEEPTKGHLEDANQLTDAEGRGKVNESVRVTIEDNLDVIKTFDDFLNSIASEEPTGFHLEDFDKSADAARRIEINELTRETIKANLDVIETSDNLLDSITSEEPIKGHLEDADQLTDAEGRGKVNESVRATIEDNLDVIKTFDDFLNSIASEEPTGCHLEDFDKSADAARRVEINELTRETIEENLDVIETSDNLLDSITSEEPTKGDLEDADQLTDAEGRGKVNESVRATLEDNLDVIKTFDDFLNSIASEEPTGCHLEDFDKSADAARRVEINELTRETIEENLDVIETSDNLLDSITSEEPTKGHLEDADQLTDAEGRGKVNESVRVTIEDNLDVIKTFDDFLNSIALDEPTKGHLEDADQFSDAERRDKVNESIHEVIEDNLDVKETFDDVLNSIASEEHTESYLHGADKWESTKSHVSVQKENIENLVKNLIKDITDKLVETDLYSLHLESGEDLIDFAEEHRTEKRMEQVTDSEEHEDLTHAEFIRAGRIAAEPKSFENENPDEDLLPKVCTFDEILTKCVSPIKSTNIQEESLKDIESLSLKRTYIEEPGLEIHEKKYSSEVLALDIVESTSRKLLTPKSIKLEGVQLIKARQSLTLSENLETLPSIGCKPNICTIDEISEQCGSPRKLENIAEVPFKDVHSVREELPFDLLGRETEGYTAEIPVEDILEATSQLIMKESDTSSDIVKAISSPLDVKQSGVECGFEEIYLSVNTFSCLQRQDDVKRKSVEQNLLVLAPRRHEVPISLHENQLVETDDRKRDRYIRKYSDEDSSDDSKVKIQGVEDSNLLGRSVKVRPLRSHLHQGSRDSLRQNSFEKIKGKSLILSSSRNKEHSRKTSLKESDTSEMIPNFHECFQLIGENLKNAERKLSMLANKTGPSGLVLNGKQQKSRRSTILPSRSKTQLSEQRRKTRGSISEKYQDQKPITSISKEMRLEQERYFKEDGAKDRQDKTVQAHPSTSETFLPRRPSSESKPDETTRKGDALKHAWPAFINVDTQNLAGISAAILEKTRALRANKGLILNKSLFSSLDECKYIKKDK